MTTTVRQRGSIIVYAALALAILAGIGALIWWADANIATSAGVRKGETNITAKWEKANRLETERLERERLTRNAITQKQEAADATRYADLDSRYRAALLVSLRRQPAGNGQAEPLSAAAGQLACPDRQADAARGLERLEGGVLALLERGDRAIARTETCRAWLTGQMNVAEAEPISLRLSWTEVSDGASR